MSSKDKRVDRIQSLFNVTNSAVRQDWETVSQKGYDFYLDNQLTQVEKETLQKQGMPDFTVNRIIPIVEMLVFYATAKQPRWQVIAREGSDTDIASVFADLSAYIWDISNGGSLFSNIVTDAVAKGVGYFLITVDANMDRGMGEVVLKQPEPYDIYIDQKSRDPLLRDAGHILIRKILPKEHLININPEHKAKIKSATGYNASEYNYSAKATVSQQDFQYKDILDSYNSEGENAELVEFIELYEKTKEPYVNVFWIVPPTPEEQQIIKKQIEEQLSKLNAELEVQLKEKELQIKQALESGQIIEERAELELQKAKEGVKQQLGDTRQQLTDQAMKQVSKENNAVMSKKEFEDWLKTDEKLATYITNTVDFFNTKIKVTCIVGDKYLYDYFLPCDEYPLIPVYYKWTGTPFPISAVAPLVGKQQEMNKAHQLLVHNASLGSSLRWTYEEGSIDIAHWEDNASAPGALLPVHSGFERPSQVAPAPLNSAFFSIIEQGKKDMEYLAGIYSSMQGDTGSQHDTYKGLLAQDEYGTRRVKAWMQNIVEPSLKQVGHLVKQFTQYVYSAPKVFRIVNPNNIEETKEIKLNTPIFNDLGKEIGKFNDYASAKFDVQVVAGSTLPVNRWAYLDEMKQLMQLGVVDDIAVLAETDIKNKEYIIKRKSKYSQMQGQIGGLEEQVKDKDGTIETLTRQLVQAGIKQKVNQAEVEMAKEVAKVKGNTEVHRKELSQKQDLHKKELDLSMKGFQQDMKNMVTEKKLQNSQEKE